MASEAVDLLDKGIRISLNIWDHNYKNSLILGDKDETGAGRIYQCHMSIRFNVGATSS